MTAPAIDPVDALDLSDEDAVSSQVEYSPTDIPSTSSPPPDPAAETQSEPKAPEVEAPSSRPALPEGYKYDEKGRVHDSTGRVVAKEKVAELLAAATPAPATEPPTPFQYRTNGATKPVDGFLQNPDGSVTVSPEKAGELRYLLNARDMLGQESEYVNQVKSKNVELERQIAQLQTGNAAEIQKAKTLVDQYTRILQNPDEAKALEEFFQMRQNFPVLLARAEAQYWEQAAKQGKTPKQDQPVEREAAKTTGLPTREIALGATTEHIERLKLEHTFRDISSDDWKQFTDRTQRTPFAYIRHATAEDAKKFGVEVNEIVFDTDALHFDIEQYAKTVRGARETAAAAAKLAADNARRTTPSVDAPPSPGSAPAPGKTRRAPTNEKEWDDFMNNDELF